MLLIVFGFTISVLMSYLLIKAYKKAAVSVGIMDIPCQRSSHVSPTPRGAGLIFSSLWLALLVILYAKQWVPEHEFYMLMPGAFVMTVTGFIDDLANLSFRIRLIIQTLVATYTLVVLGGVEQITFGSLTLHLGIIGTILCIIGIVWSINLFNFMDGADGLSSLQAVYIFSTGGLAISLFTEAHHLAYLSFALIAFLIGFLIWNFPPAKIFMGDAGSFFLGYLIAIYAIITHKIYGLPLVFWFIIYSPFIFDATITLIRRLLARKKWYSPHREFAFHRLLRAGWSHRKLFYASIVLNSFVSSLGILLLWQPLLTLPIVFVSLIPLCFIYSWIEKIRPMDT